MLSGEATGRRDACLSCNHPQAVVLPTVTWSTILSMRRLHRSQALGRGHGREADGTLAAEGQACQGFEFHFDGNHGAGRGAADRLTAHAVLIREGADTRPSPYPFSNDGDRLIQATTTICRQRDRLIDREVPLAYAVLFSIGVIGRPARSCECTRGRPRIRAPTAGEIRRPRRAQRCLARRRPAHPAWWRRSSGGSRQQAGTNVADGVPTPIAQSHSRGWCGSSTTA
jgi:hypothetical protein